MERIFSVLFLFMIMTGFTNIQAKSKGKKPNIIFIFADDWGYGDLSGHGSSFVKTPHIDKMASEGIDFTHFTVNNPVCSPSRVAVMTGQFPARQCIHQHFHTPKFHITKQMPDWMDVEGVSLPRELQKAGYVTGHFGKWHLGYGSGMPTEDKYGYDEYATFSGSETIDIPRGTFVEVDSAESFIKRHRDEPFFINLWLHVAHTDHYPSDRFMEKFSYLDEQKQVYASVIAEGDESVGRIITLLQELGLDENTLVIFSTDNGPASQGGKKLMEGGGLGSYYSVGETGGLKGNKRSLFAGGIRVPFIVRWPGTVPEGIYDEKTVVTAVDLLPTFLEAAGVDMPKDYMLDGESVLEAFKGEAFQRTKPIFWEWKGGEKNKWTWPTLGVRYGDWKLVVDVKRERKELYNLANDWAEKNDLADSNPEKLDELLQMLEAWKKSLPEEPRQHCLTEERQKK